MKRFMRMITMVLVFFFALLTKVDTVAAATVTVQVKGTYHQTEARSMLTYINQFRASSDAWYWEEDGTKTVCSGLGALTYDYGLEQIAMQRAMEAAISFSHDRPNGSECFTVLASDGNHSNGENLAAGLTTAYNTYMQWREDEDSYEGQGHRRNMLRDYYTAVGIACVEYDGIYFWVQEFGFAKTSVAATSANNSATYKNVEIMESDVVSYTFSGSTKTMALGYGQSATLPTYTAKVQLSSTWPGTEKTVSLCPKWTVADSSIVSVSGTKITAKAYGSTTLSSSFMGQKMVIKVNVTKPTLASATVTLKTNSYYYDGKAKKPAVASVVVNGKKLTAGTDYTVSYANNINIGTAIVKITGKGSYGGTVSKAFTIIPKQTTGVKQTSPYVTYGVKIAWNKVAGVDGYQVYAATSQTGSYSYIGKTANTYATKTGLKSGTVYYFKVRAYKVVSGKTYYGPLSAVTGVATSPDTPTVSLASSTYNVKASWGKVRGAYAYEVYMAVGKNSGYKKVATVNANTTSFNKGGLSRNTVYYVRVRAARRGAGGQWLYSGYSPVKYIRTK